MSEHLNEIHRNSYSRWYLVCFIPHKETITFESVNDDHEVIWCDHSKETFSTVKYICSICSMIIIFSESYKKLGIFLEILLVGPGERIPGGDQNSFKIFRNYLKSFTSGRGLQSM